MIEQPKSFVRFFHREFAMSNAANRDLRIALITELASRLNDRLGRTGLMKLIFFLQSRRDLQLGYSFRLYNYGPYDSQVMGDLKIAEGLGAVRSKSFEWPGGTGYTIGLGENASSILATAKTELSNARDAIDWVVSEFGSRNAADLEIASTIIYVDDSALSDDRKLSFEELVSSVHSIKPRHSEETIAQEVRTLKSKKLLSSIGT
jgi:uncharacterized protein